MSIDKLKTRFANGAWINNVKEFFSKTNEIIDVVNSSTPSYKVYSAILTQTGTNAPVATILENTLGDIVWTRTLAGVFLGTLNGAFIEGKTMINIPNQIISINGGEINSIVCSWSDVNSLDLYTISLATTTGIRTYTDSLLWGVYGTSIEIRVYN